MPRKKLIRTDQYFYHVTTRSNNKEWFSLPLDRVWKISQESFKKAQEHHPSVVSQYVLMANHYHLLIRTPNCDIDQFMFWFNKTFSDLLRLRSGYENRMFGSHYKWSLIAHSRYFNNVFRYIYQNPLRAGLVDRCEDYPYSTLFYTHRKKNPGFEFKKISQLEDNLELINDFFDLEKQQIVRLGLKRATYAEPRLRKAPL